MKAGLLGLAAVYHLLRLTQLANRSAMDLYVRLALALLCIAFLVREVDIDLLGESIWWAWAEDMIRIMVGLSILVWYGFLSSKLKVFWAAKSELIHSAVLALSFWGCVWYLGSWPFDKMLVVEDASLSALIEIIFELSATVTLCMAAWLPEQILPDKVWSV
ncbi:MAG: hypothetical protein VXW65_13330 [Pseudomonadota bacterium]|nr:hypothetical protein [Pseudomonadota bacterium]